MLILQDQNTSIAKKVKAEIYVHNAHKERGRISRPAPSVCRQAARRLLVALLGPVLVSAVLAVAHGRGGGSKGLLGFLGLRLHWDLLMAHTQTQYSA